MKATRITREDLERRLAGDMTLDLPFVGRLSIRQGLGVLAIVAVVAARFAVARRKHAE